ncbi:MAG: orotate phosphoribosyltransferase [Pseudomonadota bacterium]|jgi:orotate phosphoribosyltransferase
MQYNSQNFIKFAIENSVLSFGEFKTKAGRLSPYFFNAGKFNSGSTLWHLAKFYAQHIIDNNIEFDVLFGPAYKGITLASATACAINQINGKDVPFCFNRKEAKDHGEGGVLVGSSLENKKVLIIDDVISAGTSIKESINMIKSANGIPCGVLIALDRMEKSGTNNEIGSVSAIQQVEKDFGLPVSSITNLNELLTFVESAQELQTYKQAIHEYKNMYGI